MLRALAAALAATGLVCGAALALTRQPPSVPQPPPPHATTASLLRRPRYVVRPVAVPITGANQDLEQAIVRALSGVNSSEIASVSVGAPPSYTGDAVAQDAQWLTIDYFPDSTAGLSEPEWEATIVGGAVHDAAESENLASIAGFTVAPTSSPSKGFDTVLDSTLPQGQEPSFCRQPPSGRTWCGDQAENGLLALTPGRITAFVNANAAAAGLKVTSLDELQPLGMAVMAKAETRDDPWTFAASYHDVGLVGVYDQYDGLFVQFYDTHGKLIWESESNTRTGFIDYWTAPGWSPTSCKPIARAPKLPTGDGWVSGGRVTRGASGSECNGSPYEITVLTSAGKTVATVSVAGMHGYAIPLPPGRYVLVGGCSRTTFAIVTGRVTKADAACREPPP